MVIHVKDAETDMRVRELAHLRGIGITQAIREAVEEAIEADRKKVAANQDGSLAERLKPLFERLDRLPRPHLSTDKQFFDSLWGQADPSPTGEAKDVS